MRPEILLKVWRRPSLQTGIRRIHFVGIGGIGMSGLAEIMVHRGFQVTGSDRQLSDITRRLQSLGVNVFEGHEASQVDADLVVYTSAASADNPEIHEASRRGIPCVKRSVLLGEILREQRGIAVSGTHGKTTTTAMIGLLLRHASLDPTILVGGMITELGTNALPGKGQYAVVEADEYDRSFLDLRPWLTVVNNIESDHLDCYRNLDDIRFTFSDFANQTSVFGCVILNADDPNISSIRDRIHRRQRTFGLDSKADVSAVNIRYAHGTMSFEVSLDGTSAGTCTLHLNGLHNVRNALASIAVADELGLSFDIASSSLSKFHGTGRRFEHLGTVREITVIDDYAHHPTEIKSTLQGAREVWPTRRLVVAFQPHLYSRTRDYLKDFAASFKQADVVVLTDIYPARELPIPGITGETLFHATREHHEQVHYVPTLPEALDFLKSFAEPGDVVITMGAGTITTVGHDLVNKL